MTQVLKYILITLTGLTLSGFVIFLGSNDKSRPIKIEWINELKGDFDFKTDWSYPEGVYLNSYGQLDCDGFCPEGIESLKDNEGRIFPDSLTKFYQLLDTTHQLHSIQSEASCYEWGGTDFIKAKQTDDDHVICSTQMNAATHCGLIFEIKDNLCVPRIELNSVSAHGIKTYYCNGGFIKIDKERWESGILKAEFDFVFNNTDEPDQKMFWEGKIYAAIEK